MVPSAMAQTAAPQNATGEAQQAVPQTAAPAASAAATATGAAASADPTKPPPKKPKPYGGGTPLDVLMSTKLWVSPPEEKEFVKETRPQPDTLHYQSTIPAPGAEPVRPKLLNKDQLQALQQELEVGGALNERAADVKRKDFADVDLRALRKDKDQEKAKAKARKAKPEGPLELH